jgi:acetyl-CoA synthetase
MILNQLLGKTHFTSYADFTENFRIIVPSCFNFAFDVVDEIALHTPEKVAMVWCDDKGSEHIFTFGEMKLYSDKSANFFLSCGIGKGDKVMLILKRRYEFWFALLGLHKIGAVAIPATHLLTEKDIVYRNQAANIKMIVCVPDPDVIGRVENARKNSGSILPIKRKVQDPVLPDLQVLILRRIRIQCFCILHREQPACPRW